ncbi:MULTISPECIES: hypothetical protein [Myxococcus]|uniref:Lipoprotein n=1 Tax=Myxococcus llanfairpwllgwyngyllgogerychwyrndrobwllllantysiliogogogochensis TaxID=2590453 RepID=A0A540WSC4_9BACT|nr:MULTISPECIES: hypothetical protein [Myxococcus]NTX03611.1 hypothetical protein [Myxococcus sp. CA040A]NTX56042.1 hypothetical protein [Myxococcus sp. CA039A]TQF11902.1 hypothetical protein FJV41_31860 [Myxococcus llanfairpwllgwyngyllgogerychwyrndrobwllllantysiliogogogochensis]
MRTLIALAVIAVAFPAVAKPWQGVEPGVTKKDEVVKKFGEPSRTVSQDGKETIAYLGKEAIKGTSQAQFKVDPGTGLIERIDVFPGPVIDKETIETSYGPACPSGPVPSAPCYQRKLTDDFRTYFLYPKLGLAIFFNEDGKTVQSFTFTTQKAAK